jgi:hypothetical protein
MGRLAWLRTGEPEGLGFGAKSLVRNQSDSMAFSIAQWILNKPNSRIGQVIDVDDLRLTFGHELSVLGQPVRNTIGADRCHVCPDVIGELPPRFELRGRYSSRR